MVSSSITSLRNTPSANPAGNSLRAYECPSGAGGPRVTRVTTPKAPDPRADSGPGAGKGMHLLRSRLKGKASSCRGADARVGGAGGPPRIAARASLNSLADPFFRPAAVTISAASSSLIFATEAAVKNSSSCKAVDSAARFSSGQAKPGAGPNETRIQSSVLPDNGSTAGAGAFPEES